MQEPLNLQEAIFNLQKYLRALAFVYDDIISPPVDGIFESATEDSVRSFQRIFGLEPNGIVDKKTWDAIYEQYKTIQAERLLPLFPLTPQGYATAPGEKSVFVLIVQLLLRELSVVYDGFPEIEISGIYDDATQGAVRELQRASGLEITGLLDRNTYARLLTDLSNHTSF